MMTLPEWVLQPVDTAKNSGFARTRGAAQHDLFPLRDFEIDIAQHMEFAVPFVDADHANCGFGHAGTWGGKKIGQAE